MSLTLIDSYADTNRSSYSTLESGGMTYLGVAQSFTATAKRLKRVTFNLMKTGSPTGNAIVRLCNHSGTFGSSGSIGSTIATSDNYDVSNLTGSYQNINFEFSGSNRVLLSNGSYYFVQIRYSNGNASNYVRVATDNTSPSHGGNVVLTDGFANYAVTALDAVFYVYGDDTALPTITTTTPSNITATTLTTGGNVTSDGGETISERGTVRSTAGVPTTSDTKTTSSGTTGSYSQNLTSLTKTTTYYIRAYAINDIGTAYGDVTVARTSNAGNSKLTGMSTISNITSIKL